MSRLILTRMPLYGKECLVSAVIGEDNRICRLKLLPPSEEAGSMVGNIYTGKIENISQGIHAAFVRLGGKEDLRGYLSLDQKQIRHTTPGREGPILKNGDELLVQVMRDAMKGKLPALTASLSLTGTCFVLTDHPGEIGYSKKLTAGEKARLSVWVQKMIQEDSPYGIILRTNAGRTSEEALTAEFTYLLKQFRRITEDGSHRTWGTLLYEADAFWLKELRSLNLDELTGILTDSEEIHAGLQDYLQIMAPDLLPKLTLWKEHTWPLYKTVSLETLVEELSGKKVWLKSGGFLVIEQTEAFVSIDVNSGKYNAKKEAEKTYLKMNLEAAKEIARQLRLRNLSGIILVDFINMESDESRQTLLKNLKTFVREDPVKCRVVDITALGIVEMTRQKVHRPLFEDLRMLKENA